MTDSSRSDDRQTGRAAKARPRRDPAFIIIALCMFVAAFFVQGLLGLLR
ncbi:hypothetical protein NK718_21525 [Alsobacter sp. SYSU M60028]|uniref:DUF2970 domain-containing protein n=1 Tax=Alsobacter ponti TaxID=2962936 RepID=A0ABT1LHY1_9HYPH|nr:hypothetical protein [Alsobacter ponti]MCP8941110.1 hypothetical protein [Alsobacter ponti]